MGCSARLALNFALPLPQAASEGTTVSLGLDVCAFGRSVGMSAEGGGTERKEAQNEGTRGKRQERSPCPSMIHGSVIIWSASLK